MARFHDNARVVRKAASNSPCSEKAPRIRSISEYWMIARLSVVITESINKPDAFALSLSTRTTTLLGCPARAMLLVIIATMVWGKPAPSWSAWTTSAGRRFDVRKFESGNKTKRTSPHRQLAGGSACPTCCIVGSHFRSIPILGKRSQAARPGTDGPPAAGRAVHARGELFSVHRPAEGRQVHHLRHPAPDRRELSGTADAVARGDAECHCAGTPRVPGNDDRD